MKPIWIVDDDQSIRFVLEKALAREDLAGPQLHQRARRARPALDDDEPQVLVSDIRMPGGSGIDLLTKVKAKHPGAAGHHHDGVLRPGQRGLARSRAAPSNTCPSPSTCPRRSS